MRIVLDGVRGHARSHLESRIIFGNHGGHHARLRSEKQDEAGAHVGSCGHWNPLSIRGVESEWVRLLGADDVGVGAGRKESSALRIAAASKDRPACVSFKVGARGPFVFL